MLKNFLYFFLFIITTAWSTTKSFTLIIAAAELRDDYRFYHSFSNKAKKFFGVKHQDAIAVAYHSRFYTKYEDKHYTLTGVSIWSDWSKE